MCHDAKIPLMTFAGFPPAQPGAPYIGRFAPSPSGALHFGSLIAAVGSFLDAHAHDGKWLLRIEDVDTPRTVAGAAAGILHTLERFGFAWDGEIVWQSQRTSAYEATLERLKAAGHAYPCACTRRELAFSDCCAWMLPRPPRFG